MTGQAVDFEALNAWCRDHLGVSAVREVSRTRHLSVVVVLDLAGGRRVVVKCRPPEARIAGCTAVQHALWQAGYPCPRPLAGPFPLGPFEATAEEYVGGGSALDPAADTAESYARALARLVALAPAPDRVPPLAPEPPWVGWRHAGAGLWPVPDDMDADLNAQAGPAWLDDLARRLRRRLAAVDGPPVIGHADWDAHNVAWRGREVCVVHDWDSVVALPEATIAGAALPDAGIEESGRFLAAYQRARHASWSAPEQEAYWAAGLWHRAFNAKKSVTRGAADPAVRRLAQEAAERLHRSAA
ncbi:hypothetical protein GA0115240_11512 [Streptomyces sp. DvalAA-14]|uniref:hypothetical protein n=1 Tax=unclassified Streptomyces TaxID=2593676 RepID=UPI00081B2503|nr:MULTISPECIES: hypothetical protein [unclassified Streptomyces]MYS19962.1 hypothetical protein [Streptomyces sp. SID4948]SCD57564.1 hypothetical protein GA0115240_11512 [Streptomyces sp. DvalAA-14]